MRRSVNEHEVDLMINGVFYLLTIYDKQLKLHYDKEVCPRYCTNIEVLDLSHPTETLGIAKFNYHYLFLYHHIALIIIYNICSN